jgi:hypothetical protein
LETVEVTIEKVLSLRQLTEGLNLKDVIWDRLSSEPEFDYESTGSESEKGSRGIFNREFHEFIHRSCFGAIVLSMLSNIYLANESKVLKR